MRDSKKTKKYKTSKKKITAKYISKMLGKILKISTGPWTQLSSAAWFRSGNRRQATWKVSTGTPTRTTSLLPLNSSNFPSTRCRTRAPCRAWTRASFDRYKLLRFYCLIVVCIILGKIYFYLLYHWWEFIEIFFNLYIYFQKVWNFFL